MSESAAGSGAAASEPPAEDTRSLSPWLAVGDRLRMALAGEFDVMGILGQGGMAAVFLAHEYALNRKVALKVMSPALMMGEGMIERFRQEAVTQANLQHAHIVAMHGVRSSEELEFFVMQYIPGRTLQQVLRSEIQGTRPLHFDVVRSLVFQAGAALSYAHRRGVIHRDIKPGNILLNADGDAVVTDFGIAKIAEHPSYTVTGTVVGTPAYMSPEQCFAAELTPASDQYSLGVVAYELLTGRVPFLGTGFAVMQAHTTTPPPPVSEHRPDCPPDIGEAVMRMLAKQPGSRFDDINDALHAMAARSAGTRADDPVRRELVRVADVRGVEEKLSDILRGPPSPAPQTRRTTGPTARPNSGVQPGSLPPASATQVFGGSGGEGAATAGSVRQGSASQAGIGNRDSGVTAAAPASARRTPRLLWPVTGLGAVAAVAIAAWLALQPACAPAPGAARGEDTLGAAGPPPPVDTNVRAVRVDSTPRSPALPVRSAARDSVSPVTPPPRAETPEVTLRLTGPVTIRVGESAVLTARPVDAGGRALNAERIQWRSSNPATASINASTGEVRGISEGDVEIQAAGARAAATAKLAVRGSVAGRVETRTMPPPETAKAPPPNPQP
ncbi:MAG: protein kinase domain-containing protein, partial [Gemmatimonadaceae bacterium]